MPSALVSRSVVGKTSCGAAETSATPVAQVPSTLFEAVSVFLSHPSVLVILAGIGAAAYARAGHSWGLSDAIVSGAAVAFWICQEWLIHAKLLHCDFDWLGRRIHNSHHEQPYYHVSIDGLDVVLPFMLVTGVLFWAVLGSTELWLTATLSYDAMGLIYLFTHYLVHTRYAPKSGWLRKVRQHHMRHHLCNEDFWFSFTMPEIDMVLGTSPDPANVRRSESASKRRLAPAVCVARDRPGKANPKLEPAVGMAAD